LKKGAACYDELTETIREMAFRGNIAPYLSFFVENILKRLSNRDLMNFDEKYIKIMLLANLFASGLYLPKSEDENINGCSDIYLQKHPAVGDIKFEYVFEIKYVKTDAKNKNKEKNSKLADALAQIEKYKKDPRFSNRDDVKFFALVFEGKGDCEAKEV
jgi:predicted nucleic acid-binding protein